MTTYRQILALIKENSKIVAANSKAIKQLTKSSKAHGKAIEQLVESSEANKKSIEQLTEKFKASQAHWDGFMERYVGYVDNDSCSTEIFFIESLWQQDLVVGDIGDIKFDDLIANSQHWRKKVGFLGGVYLVVDIFGQSIGIQGAKPYPPQEALQRARFVGAEHGLHRR